MDMERHDFQLDELVERIKENDHRLIALQVPEGLKMQALEMMDKIEGDSEAKVILAADPCYGARERLNRERPDWPVRSLARIDIIDGKVEIID